MDVAVVVPWRGGCPDRRTAWEWCETRWRKLHPEWDLIVAELGDGPWSKARAVAAGVAATTADVLVVADADVWCDGTARAVQAVGELGGWAVPHRLVWRLSRQQTEFVTEWAWPPERFGPDALEERPYPGLVGGGLVVLTRDAWQTAPLDPRFEGWGGEDVSWGHALGCLVGDPWRSEWRLWHLWHPPQERPSRQTGSRDNEKLRRRYRAARRRPSAMRALAAEATHNLG